MGYGGPKRGYKQTAEHIAKRSRMLSLIQRGKRRGPYKGSTATLERTCVQCRRSFTVKIYCAKTRHCSRPCANKTISAWNIGRIRHTYGVAI